MVKGLPVMQETWVQTGSEDPLEKEIATHSSILLGKSHGHSLGKSLVGYSPWGSQRVIYN